MVLLSIFFTRIRSTEGSSAERCCCFVAHALALHLAVKILLQIFLYEDLSTLTLHTSVSCISLRIPTGPHFNYATAIKWKHSNIWHKVSTKHKEVRPDSKRPTIMQTTRPRITWKVLPMAQVAIFKEIFDQVRKRFKFNELFILN